MGCHSPCTAFIIPPTPRPTTPFPNQHLPRPHLCEREVQLPVKTLSSSHPNPVHTCVREKSSSLHGMPFSLHSRRMAARVMPCSWYLRQNMSMTRKGCDTEHLRYTFQAQKRSVARSCPSQLVPARTTGARVAGKGCVEPCITVNTCITCMMLLHRHQLRGAAYSGSHGGTIRRSHSTARKGCGEPCAQMRTHVQVKFDDGWPGAY